MTQPNQPEWDVEDGTDIPAPDDTDLLAEGPGLGVEGEDDDDDV